MQFFVKDPSPTTRCPLATLFRTETPQRDWGLTTLRELHILCLSNNAHQHLSTSKKLSKTLTIRCNILVGSLKNTGKLIFVKSFPILCFNTEHKLVLGRSSLNVNLVLRFAYPAYGSILIWTGTGMDRMVEVTAIVTFRDASGRVFTSTGVRAGVVGS